MSEVHPDLRWAARVLPRGVPSFVIGLSRWLARAAPRRPPGASSSVQRAGDVPVRVFVPDAAPLPRPALLWIHGGGYVMGDASVDDGRCARFSKELGIVVVSVDYRLAPECPFPAPLDDCLAAYDFVFERASVLGIDTSRVVIGGASAGAGLAAALALRIHDTKRPPPRLQLLAYPMIDDRTVTRSFDARPFRVWSEANNRMGWRAYLGREPGSDGVVDHAAPARRIDLAGLPPAWIGVGSNDLFHDENTTYAKRLREARVPTALEIVEGAFHGFDLVLPWLPVSRAFFESQMNAIRRAITP